MTLYARALASALLLLPLLGCEPPAMKQFPELTYAHMPKMGFNVAKVEVLSDYQGQTGRPHVELDFPVIPGEALKRWAADRLLAKGRTGTLRFVISNAGVIEESLKKDQSFSANFKKLQSERYNATLEATIEILDDQGQRKAFTTTQVSRARTVPEGITLNDRQQAWFDLAEEVMTDFNKAMEDNIRVHLKGYMM